MAWIAAGIFPALAAFNDGPSCMTTRDPGNYPIDVSDLTCGGTPGDNNAWGEGRLDAFAAFGGIFADGFESGDTTSWSSTVP